MPLPSLRVYHHSTGPNAIAPALEQSSAQALWHSFSDVRLRARLQMSSIWDTLADNTHSVMVWRPSIARHGQYKVTGLEVSSTHVKNLEEVVGAAPRELSNVADALGKYPSNQLVHLLLAKIIGTLGRLSDPLLQKMNSYHAQSWATPERLYQLSPTARKIMCERLVSQLDRMKPEVVATIKQMLVEP